MGRVSRREWVDLLLTHQCPDPANPSDEFAMGLIALAGGDPEVWEHGSEKDALTAYEVAWGKRPDHTWAKTFLTDHPDIQFEVRTCAEAGIAYDEFLSWSREAQDLFLGDAVLRADTCPRGHPADVRDDDTASKAVRNRCAACAKVEALDALVAKNREHTPDTPEYLGWTTGVERT